MKKKRAVAGGLLLVLGIAQSVSAGTTTVTYHVDPSYMVLVPANTTIPFNEESVNYGKIRIEEAQIEEGKCIQVELISDKKLKNQTRISATTTTGTIQFLSLFSCTAHMPKERNTSS